MKTDLAFVWFKNLEIGTRLPGDLGLSWRGGLGMNPD